MSTRLNAFVLPALACLTFASPALAADVAKNGGVRLEAKAKVVKPGPGADEHGCIPPQIWHAPSGTCVTDVLPDKPKGTQTMKKSDATEQGVEPGKTHHYVGHVTLLR